MSDPALRPYPVPPVEGTPQWEAWAETWVPGDPLYKPAGNSSYLFNFRDNFIRSQCGVDCYDAMRWTPDRTVTVPKQLPAVAGGDEITAFIAEYKAWVAAGRPAHRMASAA